MINLAKLFCFTSFSVLFHVIFCFVSHHFLFCFTSFSNVQVFISIIFYKVLEMALKVIESLHFVSLIYVFDQAIYSKACEIKWKEPAKFKLCFLMMGIFYLIMVYVSILKKRFGSAGMRDALVQSQIVADGSVDSALRGESNNRGIRLYKIFYEP